jgi:hypothetical protein
MSKKLGNINIILTNTFYEGNEKEKSEINNENNYYALINKKRKRNSSYKVHKINVDKCPSCASSLLRKHYKHIHDIINSNINIDNKNDIRIKNLENKKDKNSFLEIKNKNFNNNMDLFAKNDIKSNQETFSKKDNFIQNNKNQRFSKISKYDEKENDLINKNIINKNNNYQDNSPNIISSIFNNNNANEFIDAENEKNYLLNLNSYKQKQKNKLDEKDANHSFLDKVENQDNNTYENNNQIKILKIVIEPKKPEQIFLKVQKRIAPEI